MGQDQPNEISHEMQSQQHMQLVYARKTQERRIFMEDLSLYRKRNDKTLIKEIKDSIGPKWYQALSVPQSKALDTLEFCIYQDLLEARAVRTQRFMKALGIVPCPSDHDLMHCVFRGRDDPKAMLAELFFLKYDHSYDLKRTKYDLNARLLLSGILYLGLPDLLKMLEEQFRPDQPEPSLKPKKKPKPGPPLASPYLQKMTAICYEPRQQLRKPPPPLPNLDALNEPFDDTPPAPKPPPPPPPPPPPKKRLPRSMCDNMAGVYPIEQYCSALDVARTSCTIKPTHAVPTTRKSKYVSVEKKTYGIGNTREKLKARRKKLKAPSTGVWNAQYTICGVARVCGKSIFLLGSVSVLPLDGNIIHGGHAFVNGEYINIHCGVRGTPPPRKPDHCDCLKRWTEPVMTYLKNSKCYCGHRYDFYNEGVFPQEDLPFFEKPTRFAPMQFKFDNIYDVDPKTIHVGKEFKRVWEAESMLRIDDPYVKKPQPKKKKRSSKTCLGPKPKLEDYLKCALYRFRSFNIAARLPDIYLVPELVAWMRFRLFGPYTVKEKKKMAIKSNWYWTLFTRFACHSIPHVPVPKIAEFNEVTTWKYKQILNDKFRKFIDKYRLEMFRAHADYNNLMWPSMFQAQMPDKKFREIYYSYLFGTLDHLTLMHPYCGTETEYHIAKCIKKPYRCPPAGVENINA